MLTKFLAWVRKNLIIIFIFGLAFGLRVTRLDFVPPSLNWDEVSHGYNAYSVLKTGKDEWGQPFPLIFRAYGDYKLPVYVYLTALSETVFGFNETAVRLPSVLAGTGTVIFTFLLVRELFGQKKALLASLLVALEPWSLFLSRIAVEANLSVFFIIAGVYFFVKKKLPLAALFLGLSIWTYNSARIFVPLLLLALHLIYKPKLSKLYLAIVALLFIPMFYQLINPVGQARYKWVAILDEGTVARIVENRNQMDWPAPLPRLIHNKATYFTSVVWSNYWTHFDPNFLYFKGGSDYQFNVPNHGLLYLIGLPFLLIGIAVLLKDFKKKGSQVVLFWLAASPIASSLTREAPHTLRAIVILPVPMVLTALGVFWVWEKLALIDKKKAAATAFIAIYLFMLGANTEEFGKIMAFDYRENYSWSWQYGYKQVVNYVKDHYHDYDQVIVTKKYGEPHEFFLFFWPWDPEAYRNDPDLVRFFQSDWYWVDRFDKFYFINDWQVKDLVLESGDEIGCVDSECLLVSSPDNAPAGFSKIETINFLDGKPAFEIYEN